MILLQIVDSHGPGFTPIAYLPVWAKILYSITIYVFIPCILGILSWIKLHQIQNAGVPPEIIVRLYMWWNRKK